MNVENTKQAALVLRAINHELRRQILSLLANEGSLTVTEVYCKLKLEQPVASQHLAILRRAGFVETERRGKFIHYSVNHQRLMSVNRLAEKLAA